MTDSARIAAHRQRLGLIVLGVLGLVAGGLSFLGTRDSWQAAATPTSASVAGPFGTINEPALPSGPHQAAFQSGCIICHSARLPLTQPQLSREKWIEVVHKMAAAYGAPVSRDEEAEIVEYLLAVQAPQG
jgi:hypothetical protein